MRKLWTDGNKKKLITQKKRHTTSTKVLLSYAIVDATVK